MRTNITNHTASPILIIFAVLLLAIARPALAEQAGLAARCAGYTPFAVDISSLLDFYGTLPQDEKEEQLKDWAFYGLLASLGFTPDETDEITGQPAHMRYASLKKKYGFTVSPGRAAFTEDGSCVMLVPRGAADDKLTQGFIFDKQRVAGGPVPKNIYLFSYDDNISSGGINVSYIRTVPGKSMLSQEYGYFEKEVSDAVGVSEFLKDTNALTSVKINKNSVTLRGRKNKFGPAASIFPEDAAALCQAYIKNIPPEQEAERKKQYTLFISKKYNEALRNNKQLRVAIKAGNVKYLHIMTRLKKMFPYTPAGEADANVGFSLDPLYDIEGISKDLKSLIEKTGRFAAAGRDGEFSVILGSNSAELSSIAGKISASGGILPLLKFKRKFTPPKNSAEGKLDSVLQQIELENTYQSARYDGRVKGTDAAMILFYTDLTAKLWALDYNGLAPKNDITGFRTLAGIKVPKLYWDDFVKLSKTRLWFGLRQDSFDINGDEITFEPVSTRVYAASSDPLYPGKESKPNYQSGEFLGWWDDHYYAVADYEPYYYKLNELLKWSCLMMVLKEKHSGALDFLAKEPVPRGLDFEAWYKNTAGLKNRTDLPFIEKGRFRSSTECFKLISSAGYPLMGYTYFISGGVSLASVKDIRAKMSKSSANAGKKGRSAVKTAKAGKPGISARLVKGAAGQKPASTGRAAPEKNKARAVDDFGTLSANTENRTVKLEWHKGEGVMLDECVNSLADGEKQIRGEDVFRTMKGLQKVVRIELGKTYLIKTKQLADKWIYLAVNPSGPTTEYRAKAAGTEPESDIFCAKTISSSLAEKMVLEKNGFVMPIR